MWGGLRRPFWPLQVICVLAAVVFAAAFSISTVHAQYGRGNRPVPEKSSHGSLSERSNANAIAIVSGNLDATYLSVAHDLSAVLDDGDEFRILPVVSKGGGQNINDVRFLNGVDLGITQSNLLNAFRKSGEIGNIDDKIVYIAKLFNEEMHVVVRAESGITAIEQLGGRKVNFSDSGSGTQLTARDIFKRLNIAVEEINVGEADAVEKLKTGEIAATVLIAGKPTASLAKLRRDDGFRFLPVRFAKELQADYLPATITSEDYPAMLGNDQGLETVAVGAVLIAYNWPKGSYRHKRIEAFVERFFPKLADFLKPPRHPKWREANLAAVLPGWTRFDAAEQWVERNRKIAPSAMRGQFNQFLATRVGARLAAVATTPEEREQLFEDFLRWNQARERR